MATCALGCKWVAEWLCWESGPCSTLGRIPGLFETNAVTLVHCNSHGDLHLLPSMSDIGRPYITYLMPGGLSSLSTVHVHIREYNFAFVTVKDCEV